MTAARRPSVTVAHLIRCATLLGLASCLAPPPNQATDPLTSHEITAIADTLRARGLLGEGTVLTYLALHEPGKADLEAGAGTIAGRQVDAQLLDRQRGGVLDLTIAIPEMTVVSERRRDGVAPGSPPSMPRREPGCLKPTRPGSAHSGAEGWDRRMRRSA